MTYSKGTAQTLVLFWFGLGFLLIIYFILKKLDSGEQRLRWRISTTLCQQRRRLCQSSEKVFESFYFNAVENFQAFIEKLFAHSYMSGRDIDMWVWRNLGFSFSLLLLQLQIVRIIEIKRNDKQNNCLEYLKERR